MIRCGTPLRAWLESGAKVTLRSYARRYGVDRYTACDELTMLGVRLPAKDRQWAVRPPPAPKRSRGERPPAPPDDGLPPGWIEWGGEIMFAIGFTAGGAPYGATIDQIPPDDLPEELKELAEIRRALRASPVRHDDFDDVLDGGADDDLEVPYERGGPPYVRKR